MSWRADRINEIPQKTKQLKNEKAYCIKMNWIGAAAMIQKRIDDLNKEFKEIYDSFGEKNEEVEN